jgi:hypothetical protein
MPKPILKNGVRILRPEEYEALRTGAGSLKNQTRLDGLLLTGLRYVEAQRFQDNSDWLDGRFVHLPASAQRKARRKQRERWVRLSDRGVTVIPYFLKGETLPSWKAWTQDLKRWAINGSIDAASLGPKTTRKTWESWLVSSHPERALEILLSQGHTIAVSLNHYLGLPFSSSDREQMQEWVAGWEK